MSWDSKEFRERWEFVFKGVQTAAVVGGTALAVITYLLTAAQALRASEVQHAATDDAG